MQLFLFSQHCYVETDIVNCDNDASRKRRLGLEVSSSLGLQSRGHWQCHRLIQIVFRVLLFLSCCSFSVFFHISSRILVFKLLVIPIFMLEEYSVSVLFYIFKLRSASLRTPMAKRKYRFRLLIIKMHNDLFRRRNTMLVD